MKKLILPIKKINKSYSFQGDKSISHRVVLMPLLFPCVFFVKNLSKCEDVKTSIEITKQLGVGVSIKDEITVLDGSKVNRNFGSRIIKLYCGNSGTSARLLCGVLSNFIGDFVIYGDESLSKRPMRRVVQPISKMGVEIFCGVDGTLPIEIKSNGKTKAIVHDNKECSAQVKSAIQLASLASGEESVISEPYLSRDHTERLLSLLLKSKEKEFNLEIPGDPSSAAYFAGLSAILPDSKVVLKNILLNPTRIEFFNVIKEMGAKVSIVVEKKKWEPVGNVEIEYGSLHSIKIDNEKIPSLIDELPLLAILMSQANGISSVRGAKELRYKETDRIAKVIEELKRLGVICREYDDGFDIVGPADISSKCLIHTGKDHRIAMAFSILAMKSSKGLIIEDAECVNISFPDFFEKIFTN